MAVDERPPRHHVVDEPVAVDVLERRSGCATDEERRAADGLKGADGAVDATGEHLNRSSEELLTSTGVSHVDAKLRIEN
jgi:hypothetical protein